MNEEAINAFLAAFSVFKTMVIAWAIGFFIVDILELRATLKFGHSKYWDKIPPRGLTREKMIRDGLNEKARGFSVFTIKFCIAGVLVLGSCAFFGDIPSRIALACIGCILIFYAFVIKNTPSSIENSERNRVD